MTDTATASPRPWRVEESIGGWKACVSDANGNPVASCWGGGPTEQQEKAEAIAALIVDAVNYYKPDLHCDWRELTPEEAVAHCREVAARLGDTPCARDHLQLAEWIEERERLRDLVRRLAKLLLRHTGDDCEGEYSDSYPIYEEARKALGENKP